MIGDDGQIKVNDDNTIELIPKATGDRAEIEARLWEQFHDLEARLIAMDDEIDAMRGDRDYQVRARRLALRRERRELEKPYRRVQCDLHIGMIDEIELAYIRPHTD